MLHEKKIMLTIALCQIALVKLTHETLHITSKMPYIYSMVLAGMNFEILKKIILVVGVHAFALSCIKYTYHQDVAHRPAWCYACHSITARSWFVVFRVVCCDEN